jgi:hypothetical protein
VRVACRLFEILLRAQQGKIELCNVDTPDLVPGQSSSFSIGIGHRIQQMMAGRIRMALDNGNAS